jgi:subtilisin-like proprotein convertase family protein
MSRNSRRFLRLAAPVVALVASPMVAQATLYTSPGGAILDPVGGVPPPLIINFAVVDPGNVAHIDLTLTGLTHTWAGDLIVTLQKTAGPSADIMRRPGASTSTGLGDSSDFGGTYRFIDTGVDPIPALVALPSTGILPSGDYWATTLGTNTTSGNKVNLDTVFGGTLAAGTWTLTITDNAGGDTGSVQSATLNVVVPEPATIGAVGLAAGGLLLRRRRSEVRLT